MINTILAVALLLATPADDELSRVWEQVQLAEQQLALAVEQQPTIAEARRQEWMAEQGEKAEKADLDRLVDDIKREVPNTATLNEWIEVMLSKTGGADRVAKQISE
jgi:hypothetical protein